MNKRQSLRFDKVFPVLISSDQFGECNAMARNISAGGILLELQEPLPLGTRVRVHFSMNGVVRTEEVQSGPSIVARGEVKNHYFLNFCDDSGPRSMTGMAVRFTEFETESRDLFAQTVGQLRVMH
jgi:hypothetical protein